MIRVLIRPLKIEDAEISLRWRNDPDIWEYTGNRPTWEITHKIEDAWIRNAINEKDSSRFAIEADGQYIGNIQITNIVEGITGQYHIFIGEKSFWGKGIATRATWQIIRYAKEVLKIKHLYLIVDPEHKAAIRIYEKCGFKRISEEIKMELDLECSIRPKVSIQMITYNHEKYIHRSISSLLMQRTDFDFEIVVGEDFSTDKTRIIIENLASRYPGKFKLLFNSRNIGALANQLAVSEASTGDYIAICEGDDYWNDPNKLQKQVDFLDNNDDVGLVYGNAYLLMPDGYLKKRLPRIIQKFEDLLSFNGIGTATTCFRRDMYDKFRSETSELLEAWVMGDYPFYLWVYLNSKIYGFSDYFSVYLKHGDSSTAFRNFPKAEKFILAVIKIKSYFYNFYKGEFRLNHFLKSEYDSLFKLTIQYGSFFKGIYYFRYLPFNNLKVLFKLLWNRVPK